MISELLRQWSSLSREEPVAERLDAHTFDGLRLAVWRVRPSGPSRGAVLLLHGLGANRFAFNWPGRSLAQYLAGEGFDCFVGELRGAGGSASLGAQWDFHDYLEHDVPALLNAVRSASGQDKVHFIGHSMGGILMMCHGILRQGEGLRSGLALGSALDFREGRSGFAALVRARRLVKQTRSLPFGLLARLLAPALARVADPFAGFNFHPSNAEASLVREVYSNVFGVVPMGVVNSLAAALEEGGLKSRTGEAFLPRLGRFQAPLLLVSASDDRQVPAQAVEATARACGAQLMHFGTAFGHQAEYGHFDLLLGKHAPGEVWPAIAGWLHAPVPPAARAEG